MRPKSLCLIVLTALVGGVHSFGPKTDRITNLPGAPKNLNFEQFSGYAHVGPKNRRALFYWFVESQSKRGDEPVLLWLNGGPGCSSMTGLLTENGPFVVQENMTLSPNKFSWNKLANVIYLESPSGVGFSHSSDPNDYINVTDSRAAGDVVDFLVQFFRAYPQLAGRKFVISGESYGGHYVPTTAEAILEYNARTADPDARINLKGIFVGNPWTLPEAESLGTILLPYVGYNLVSLRTSQGIIKHCSLFEAPSPACRAAQSDVESEVGRIRIYGIYEPFCYSSGVTGHEAFLRKLSQVNTSLSVFAKKAVESYNRSREMKLEQASSVLLTESAQSAQPKEHSLFSYIFKQMAEVASAASVHLFGSKALDEAIATEKASKTSVQRLLPNPCVENFESSYLNRPDVQGALHVGLTAWSECNMLINRRWNRVDFMRSMLPVHSRLMRHGIKVYIYSGDMDAIVSTHGTKIWIEKMATDGMLKLTHPWSAWYDSDTKQLGGYRTIYNGGNFTFSTVHGAGHMAPSFQPRRALDLLSEAFRNFGIRM